MSTMLRDSGAGAYSKGLPPPVELPPVELVETTVTFSQSKVK
jgi:hypothetical protein